MDANGNGAVEFEELAAAIALLMTQRALVDLAQLLKVFHAFDRDGNGYISAAELARSMARMGQPLTFVELTQMMREADGDGDEVVSFTEFAAVMASVMFGFDVSHKQEGCADNSCSKKRYFVGEEPNLAELALSHVLHQGLRLAVKNCEGIDLMIGSASSLFW